MTGGISDGLVIGFDMGGDDKPCLTVARRTGRGIQIINVVHDLDAKRLYDELTQYREKKAVPMKYRIVDGHHCPRCEAKISPGLPMYHGLKEFYCIRCGLKLSR